MPRRVALATYARAPDLAPDDRLLLPALANLGVEGVPAVWSDASVEWGAFDGVILRSCWDYHRHIAEFRIWLDRLAATGRPVSNSPKLVRWNADKHYLVDLAQRGVATVPTIVVARGDAVGVESVLAERKWTRFVLKPAISASGYETYLLRAPLDDAARATVARVVDLGDALVQPFAEEVGRDGEFSFTFLEGAFSHATLKRTTAGEFRVQTEHGGSVEPVLAPAALTDGAARVLRALPEVPLYARVDGIARGGDFLLMELELIEPNLFLEYADGAAERLARAIVTRCASR